jgi:hypothetical protein
MSDFHEDLLQFFSVLSLGVDVIGTFCIDTHYKFETYFYSYLLMFMFLMMMVIEPRVFHMLGRYSTAQLYHQAWRLFLKNKEWNRQTFDAGKNAQDWNPQTLPVRK